MRVRYKGDGSVERDTGEPSPCVVFGQVFAVGEWVEVAGNSKLATNPMFDVDTDGDGEPGPSVEELRALCDEQGIHYRLNAGVKRLLELLG